LYYDPVKVIKIYQTDPASVTHSIMHSFMHCYFLHPFFKDKVEPKIWDLACDIVVENIIDKMNEDVLYDAKERELSANLNNLRNMFVPFYIKKIYSELQSFNNDYIERLSQLFRYDLHLWYDNRTSDIAEKDRPDPLGFDEDNDLFASDDAVEMEEERRSSKHDNKKASECPDNENSTDDLLNMLLSGLNINNSQESSNADDNESEENDADTEGNEEVSDTDENSDELSGTDENGKVLSGTDENGKVLSGTDENGKVLSGTDENGKVLSGTDENSEELSGTDENGKELPDTNENGEELSGTDENGKELPDTNENGEELSGTDENGEALSGTDENDKELPDTNENGEEKTEFRNSLFSDETINKWNTLSNSIKRNLYYTEEPFLDREMVNEMFVQLNSATRPDHDFRNFLKQFARNKETMKVNNDEFDYIYYTQGLTLYNNIPLIEPLEYKDEKKISELVIAIDTSGSVHGELVRKFIKKTYEIISDRQLFGKDFVVHILQCDEMIQDYQIVRNQTEMENYIKNLTIKGFGCTDFMPVFDMIDEMKMKKELTDLQGLLYFTDGFACREFDGFPSKKPDYKTTFIYVDGFNNNYDVPPWVIIKTIGQYELGDEPI